MTIIICIFMFGVSCVVFLGFFCYCLIVLQCHGYDMKVGVALGSFLLTAWKEVNASRVTSLTHWYISIQMCSNGTCLPIMIWPCIKIRTILFLWYLLWYFKEVITLERLKNVFCKWLDEFLSNWALYVTLI